jgi:uncharacterized protein YfiM (DUF2279 family)
MIKVLAMATMLQAAWPGGPWLGADKIKHFMMSAFVQSATFSAARWTGASRPNSHLAGAAATLSVGLWKELYDRKTKRPFSVPDLVWDAAGAASAAALLNQSR